MDSDSTTPQADIPQADIPQADIPQADIPQAERVAELEAALDYYRSLADDAAGHTIRADARISLLRKELTQQERAFAVLSQLYDRLSATAQTDLDAVCAAVLEVIGVTLKVDQSAVLLPVEGKLAVAHHLGFSPEAEGRLAKVRLEPEGFDEPLVVNRATPAGPAAQRLQSALDVRYLIAVPVRSGEEAHGLLLSANDKEAFPFYPPFGPRHVETFNALSGFLAAARINAQLFHDLRRSKEALEAYNARLSDLVDERTAELQASLADLQAAQAQLVHQEKMASLGALTAGIAHEIKNPLNFVTNFSSLSSELADELAAALDEGDLEEIRFLSEDLKMNTQMIEKHGKRADSIVKNMMQHARTGSGERAPTDLNALVAEHVDLAYHGKRAQTADFNADIERDLGAHVGEVEVVGQELGRVVLNLVGNAFDAVMEHAAARNGEYAPRVQVSTRRTGAGTVEIRVEDNGPGISEAAREKLFEPFFTTKETGKGTGLGLSMSHDIVTQGHGGTLEVESTPGQGAAFVVRLPATPASVPPPAKNASDSAS